MIMPSRTPKQPPKKPAVRSANIIRPFLCLESLFMAFTRVKSLIEVVGILIYYWSLTPQYINDTWKQCKWIVHYWLNPTLPS